MNVARLTLALVAGGITSTTAHAGADYSPQWWIYSMQQVCQMWSDGVARCIPVALAGPAPTYAAKPLDALMPAPHLPAIVPSMPTTVAAPPPVATATQTPQTPPAAPPVAAAQPATATTASPLAGFDPATNPYLVYTPYAKKGQAAQAQATAPAKPDPAAAPRAAQAAQAAPAAVPPIATAVTTAPIPPQVVAQVLLATPPQPPVGISATPIGASPPGSGPTAPAREVAAGTSFAIRLEDAMTHFEFDNAELTETGRMTLDAWLKQLPPGLRVRITGHADRFGSNRYNMSLSRRRAESVKHYLADKGMRAEDMVVFAKGETQPLVHCKGGATPKTKACLAPNRRVEIKRN